MHVYQVNTEDNSFETENLEKANEVFKRWADNMMAEMVVADETYIELLVTYEDETYKTIKKWIAVVDENRSELGTPEQEGFPEWDYWAKWKEVV